MQMENAHATKNEINLRRIREDDLLEIFNARNDPDIYKWCRQTSPLHWNDHVRWYERQSSDPSLDMFAIEHCETTFFTWELIGVTGLTSIDLQNGNAEFSCYIFPEEQGKGYAKKALKSLFNHGFNSLGLHLIWGETFDGNKALSLFMDHLGMNKDAIRREFYFRDGKWIDSILVSITSDEWKKHVAI